MTRLEILSHAIFDTGGNVDDITFGPISQPCLVVLKRRKNIFLTATDRDQDEHEAVGEILFVLSRSKEERAAMFRDSVEEWDLKVGEFMAGLDADTLPKFRDEYLAPAMQALALAMAESEAPGKPAPSRPTSRSLPKEPVGSDSPNSPERSESNARSGTSAHAPSSSSSTRKRSATGRSSAGSTGRKQAPKQSPNSKRSRTKK